MAYTDFIAAIDLGTSHIVGMVGTKNASGALSILAYEVEKAEGSIRRGCVYNGEEVAYHIGLLLRKLENKLDGAKIDKVYIGIGGQSLRSMDYTVNKVLGSGGEVTEAILQEMAKDCRMYRPAELDVFDIVSPAYYLDDRAENEPLGVNCSRIDAKFKLIVGRPVLRRSIENTVKERIKRKVPRVLVSPIALANLARKENEQNGFNERNGYAKGIDISNNAENNSYYYIQIDLNISGTSYKNIEAMKQEALIKLLKENDIVVNISEDGEEEIQTKYFKCESEPIISDITGRVSYMKFVEFK